MLESLDNSNGIQYYGGNDPKKMSGRFKKSELAGFKGSQPFLSSLTKGGTIQGTSGKGRKLEITYQKKEGFNRAHVNVKNLSNPSLGTAKVSMTKNELHSYIANLRNLRNK
jgi:hypothetical protein